MVEIMQRLHQQNLFQLEKKKTAREREYEKELQFFIELLYPGLQNIDLKTDRERVPNITDVLSLIDHLCFYNIPPHPVLSEEKLQHFRFLLDRAIYELLATYENIPYTPKERQLLNLFTGPIKNAKRQGEVSIITTNYDLIIDHEFYDLLKANAVDYGMPYRNVSSSRIVFQPEQPVLRYFKLHGSLNWLKCDLCGHYYINHDGEIVHQSYKSIVDDQNTCVCNRHLRLKSVLVTPSIVRDIRDSNLLQVWKGALEAIRTADKLVIIGYSFPAEDLAIKSIILRGFNGRERAAPLNVEVVQLGDAAKNNYLNFFGAAMTYHSRGLEAYLKRIPPLE